MYSVNSVISLSLIERRRIFKISAPSGKTEQTSRFFARPKTMKLSVAIIEKLSIYLSLHPYYQAQRFCPGPYLLTVSQSSSVNSHNNQ